MKRLLSSLAVLIASHSNAVATVPSIESYGELPTISGLALSPDGKNFAYIRRDGENEFFIVSAVGGNIVGAAKGEFKARYSSFADSNHAIFHASDTVTRYGFVDKWEQSGALSFNLETKKVKLLLRGTDEIYPAQSGLGRIIGRYAGKNKVFMPAFSVGDGAGPTYDVFAVDLDTGRGAVHAEGRTTTNDWFVDEAGTILAREDFNEKEKAYRIFTRKNGKLELLLEQTDVSIPSYTLLAVSSDQDALIVGVRPEGEQFDRVSRLAFDGGLSAPLYRNENRDVDEILITANRVAFGVRFSGMTPKYLLNDKSLNEMLASVLSIFVESSVHLEGWTDDFKSLLLLIEGGPRAPAYYLFDVEKKTLAKIANMYDKISDQDVGLTTPIEYSARDGRKIPAILTLPLGKELSDKLPLIVMPHGGPEAYDSIGFDYMAQFFASRGYLVFQPNFRGSGGFGIEHLEAGYGEWGGKMQDDVTDGVKILIRKGWADAERVCIVGGSYGGYSALAGGAFTPDLYKCVAAVAPVSDLNAMLIDAREKRGKNSVTYAYWTKLIGDRGKDKDKINAISPVNAAANFKAPVLLIHGTDDTVVPFSQSAKMEAALKKQDKEVRLVRLKGEDHWLSQSETRVQTLRELDAFVAAHIGGE